MSRIATCLWFDKDGEDAARFYTSMIPNSRIDRVTAYKAESPAGNRIDDTMIVEFTLDGQQYQAINGAGLKPAAVCSSAIYNANHYLL